MQAAATLALMGRRERDLKNLGLTLAFHLIEVQYTAVIASFMSHFRLSFSVEILRRLTSGNRLNIGEDVL